LQGNIDAMTSAHTSLEGFLAGLRGLAGAPGALPPVERWQPAYCGEAGLEIRADGSWWHEGARMTREPLVRLFASILRKEADGRHYLVTPAEKIAIAVADAPFLAVRVDRVGQGRDQSIAFTTNMGDVGVIDAQHPLAVRAGPNGQPRPYVRVRGGLEARVLRAPFYELVDWAQEDLGALGVWSGGAFFPLGEGQADQIGAA
jgi:hypothetical protein